MTTQTDVTLVPAVKIRLNRAEGPTYACGTWHEFVGDTAWFDSRRQLAAWSGTAPRDGSVDKTDFEVHYADGHVYRGTFGLKFTDTDLAAHMRVILNHVVENRSGFNDPIDIRDCREFLERYAFED